MKFNRDFVAGQLIDLMWSKLEDCIHLTRTKRIEIAEKYDRSARMTGGTCKDVEDFLSRWRRAQRMLYREKIKPLPGVDIVKMFEDQNVSPESLAALKNTMEIESLKKMNHFMNERIDTRVEHWLRNRCPPPATIEACIDLMPTFIEIHTRTDTKAKGPHINVIGDGIL